MKQWWSFFDETTGELGAMQIFADSELASKNRPTGHAAVPGRHNRETHVIDVVTLKPVARSEPRPLNKFEQTVDAFRSIGELERRTGPRALREAVLSMMPDGPEKTRLADLDAAIATIAVNAGIRKN